MKLADFGHTIDVETIKKGLRELNQSLHFDVGGRLGIYHPRIHRWQGVFYNQKHVATLDRGPMVPEYNTYALTTMPNGTKVRGAVFQVGWRHTFERLSRRGIPGVSWDSLCKKFGVDRKNFVGDPAEHEVDVDNKDAVFV